MRVLPLYLTFVVGGCVTPRQGELDVDQAFQKANPEFLKQQESAFKQESSAQTSDRQHRYVFSSSVRQQQLDTLLAKYNVAETNAYEVDPREVLFGVPSIGDRFSRHTLFHHKRKDNKRDGMLLDEVVAYLEKHTIEPVDVPIHVLKVDDQVIAMNNKDLAVLAMIGAHPEKIVKHSLEDLPGVGVDSVHEVLSHLERMPGRRGSATVYLRSKGVTISGAIAESYAWDAPFARQVTRPAAKK